MSALNAYLFLKIYNSGRLSPLSEPDPHKYQIALLIASLLLS